MVYRGMKKLFVINVLIFYVTLNAQTSVIFNNPLNLGPMSVDNNFLYVGQIVYGNIYKINLSNLQSNFFVHLDGNINDIFIDNNYLFASIRVNDGTSNNQRLVKVNLNSTNTIVETVFEAPLIGGICIENSKIYFNGNYTSNLNYNGNNCLFVYDLNENNPPTIIANDLINSNGSSNLLVKNNYLYATDLNQIVKYNLSIPNSPKILVANNLSAGVLSGISFSESSDYIYVSSSMYSSNTYSIIKVNIVDGSVANVIDVSPRDAFEIYYSNNMIYATTGVDEVYKVDLNLLNSFNNMANDNTSVVFPNPSSEYVYLSNCKFISLYDLTGKEISISHTENQINISNIIKGIYILKFMSYDNKLNCTRLIKN